MRRGARIGWHVPGCLPILAAESSELIMTPLFATECEAYRSVERAIEYLRDHVREQPRLADVAARVGL